MGVRIIRDKDGTSCLYCSTTGWAFGRIFEGFDRDPQEFLDWLEEDPRHLTNEEFESKFYEWLKIAGI